MRRFRQRHRHRTWTWSCPTPSKSLREGAIAPWNTPAYAHELKELLALARDYDIPVDVPFRELPERIGS